MLKTFSWILCFYGMLNASVLHAAKPFPLNYGYINDGARQYIKVNGKDTSKGSPYWSLHPDLNIKGIIYKHLGANSESNIIYTKEIFGALVAGAMSQIKKHKELYFVDSDLTKPNALFWNFLLIAISIPHHESNLIHFRNTVPEKCSDFKNSLDNINSLMSDKDGIEYMKKTYYSEDSPILPACDYLSQQESINQLLQVNNDTGIMQINVDAHKEMRQPDAIFNMYRHIDYALEDLSKALMTVYNSKDDYSVISKDGFVECSFFTNPFSHLGAKNNGFIYALTQSLWAGKHNTGNLLLKSVCRPQMGNDGRDVKFKIETLNAILGLTNEVDSNGDVFISRFENYLSTNKKSLEYLAFKEIVNGVKAYYAVPGTKRFDSKNVMKLAETYRPAFSHSTLSYEMNLNLEKPHTKGKYFLKEKYLNLHLKPEFSAENQGYCGKIVRTENEYLTLNLNGESITLKDDQVKPPFIAVSETWAPISIPKLRKFKVEWAQNQNRDACRNAKEFWANIQYGKEKFLEATGESEPGIYYVRLNDKIKNSLTVRETYSDTATIITSLLKSSELPIKVVKEYRSPYNSKYPKWLMVEINHKKAKYGWIAEDFIELIDTENSKDKQGN